MELVNFFVILISCLICLVWAMKKREEIRTMSIDCMDEIELENQEEHQEMLNQGDIHKDQQRLEYVADLFQEVTLGILSRMNRFFLFTLIIACFLIYYFFEKDTWDIAQPIFFFIGGYSQIIIGKTIFKNYRIYDPRIIYLSRYSLI